MLQLLICFSTSGQTAAWTSLYLSTNSGLSLTICANRLPGLRCLTVVGDRGSALGGLALSGAVGLDHIVRSGVWCEAAALLRGFCDALTLRYGDIVRLSRQWRLRRNLCVLSYQEKKVSWSVLPCLFFALPDGSCWWVGVGGEGQRCGELGVAWDRIYK